MIEVLRKEFGKLYVSVQKESENGVEYMEMGTVDGMWMMRCSDKCSISGFVQYLLNNEEDGERIVNHLIVQRFYVCCGVDANVTKAIQKVIDKNLKGPRRLPKDESGEFMEEMKGMTEMME